MRPLTNRLILLVALCFGLAQAVSAEPDREPQSGASSAPAPYSHSGGGPAPGNCSLGTAERDLDVNGVLARVFNTGSLFFGNSTIAGDGYLVPQASANSPIFASGIWIGGLVDGEIRVAGARYTNYELWPGPLNADGTLPDANDCSPFDRIFRVSKTDIQDFEGGGAAARDLADWPASLGAPVIAAPDNGIDDDGDGLIDEGTDGLDNDGDVFIDERDEQERRIDGGYDLAAGDRPEVVGDQALWWVMNDVGNVHSETGSNPLGVEVQVHAFSFSRADALGEATFYRYRVINKSGVNIDETYLSVFSDPDLGDATDDWVGSDTTLSLGYVYNGDNLDLVYGVPPAEGYDFFQGPIVDLDGDDVRTDTLGLTRFTYFCNGCTAPATQDPVTKEEYYNHMLGLWKDGTPFTAAGSGFETDGPETVFAFPGDPVTNECWSMANSDCKGVSIAATDQRLIVHTGPFTLESHVPQDIVFGIVHGQGSDNLSSVTALRAASQLAQAAYDADFEIASPPPAPPLCDANSTNPERLPGSGFCLEAAEQDGQMTLVWGYPSNSENFLGSYSVLNRLLPPDSGDDTYDFEGFNIYQYPTSGFAEGSRQLIATYDLINGVTLVRDERFDANVGVNVPFIAAFGTDSGIQYFHEIEGLTNFTDYFFGVSAYAYIENEFAVGSRIIESTPRQITVRPSMVDAGSGGSIAQGELGNFIVGERVAGSGAGALTVQVVDPTAVLNAEYRVEFYEFEADTDGNGEPDATLTTYNVIRDGTIILNGQENYEQTGVLLGGSGALWEGVSGIQNIIIDGLEFFTSAAGDVPLEDTEFTFAVLDEEEVVDVAGDGGGIVELSYDGQDETCPDPSNAEDYGCLNYGIGNTVWHEGNVNDDYYVTAGGGVGELARIARYIGTAAPDDFEMRFTSEGGYGVFGFTNFQITRVPFEIWNIGNPDIPEDDVRMIPFINPNVAAGEGTDWADSYTGTDGWPDSPCEGGCPMTDWVYWLMPDRPEGYDLFEQAAIDFGVGSVYDTTGTVDGDTQVDDNPVTGVACGNQSLYADWCYKLGLAAVGDQTLEFTYPIGRFALSDLAQDGTTPPAGTVIRVPFVPEPSVAAGDVFEFSTADFAFVTDDAATAEAALDLITIVPNPYMGQSAYETGNLSRIARFTNLPEVVTIRVYTVAGSLVKTLTKDGSSRSLDWNLTTDSNLPIASGMYLIHVDVPGVGERVLKFGVVQRRTRITVF